jgi:purine-binding chemotaxis protein CheW
MNKETREILKLRAIAMARESEEKTGDSSVIQLITFMLANEMYGLESAFIREVYPLKEFTPLPGMPPYIFGVINVRGQIIPVIDLKKLFSLREVGITELNKVIILNNDQMEFGILADLVHGTQCFETLEIRKAPHTLKGIGYEYLLGVTKEKLIILNAERLLNDKNIVVNDTIA